jgi:hypothetical protein
MVCTQVAVPLCAQCGSGFQTEDTSLVVNINIYVFDMYVCVSFFLFFFFFSFRYRSHLSLCVNYPCASRMIRSTCTRNTRARTPKHRHVRNNVIGPRKYFNNACATTVPCVTCDRATGWLLNRRRRGKKEKKNLYKCKYKCLSYSYIYIYIMSFGEHFRIRDPDMWYARFMLVRKTFGYE